MTPRPDLPLLPMAGQTHGNRSAVTCHLRCGDACSIAAPNTTETSYFRDVAAKALSRRSVVGTGLTVAALGGVREPRRRGPEAGRPRRAGRSPCRSPPSRPWPPPSTT